MRPVAVITGANRGIGRATAEGLARLGLHIVVCARRENAADEVVAGILEDGGAASAFALEVTDRAQVATLAAHIDQAHGRWDVLVNNAGLLPDAPGHQDLLSARNEDLLQGFETNTLGALAMIQVALPRMAAGGYGRIVNLSTGMAGLSEMGGGHLGYRLSKVALNALTRIAHAEASAGVLVNSVCPGWVKTEMGGPNAPRSVADGARGVIWAATLPEDGPSGGFFRDGKPIPW